jgi:hypothetical protein
LVLVVKEARARRNVNAHDLLLLHSKWPAKWRPLSGCRSERPVAPVDALVDALVWMSG